MTRKTRVKLPLMFIVLGFYNFACEHRSTDVSIHSTIKDSWVHSDTNVCLPLDESKSRSFVATSKYFCPCDFTIVKLLYVSNPLDSQKTMQKKVLIFLSPWAALIKLFQKKPKQQLYFYWKIQKIKKKND